jgi:hypothetical protein
VRPDSTYRGVAMDGYTVRWSHGGYDLLRSTDKAAERPAWLVRCNVHGETRAVASGHDGDACGSRASRATWCTGCAWTAAMDALTAYRRLVRDRELTAHGG